MPNLAQLNYTEEEVKRILNSSRTVAFEFDLLDRNELCIGNVTASGSIDCDTSTAITRAGRLTIKESNDIDYINERIRPKIKVLTERGWLTYNLGIYLLSSPETQKTNGMYTKDTEIYDKSTILSEDKLTSRQFFASGTGYTDNVITILNGAGITKTNIKASDKTLPQDIEFEIGTSKLDAINQLLKAINYNNLYFDENGIACITPYVLPSQRKTDISYSTGKDSIVFDGVTKKRDLFNCPNVFVRYYNNPDSNDTMIATYTNNSPSDKLSTINRGRSIVDVQSVADIADQTTLEEYVLRVANETQVYETIRFNTALMPNHSYMDCLSLNIDNDIIGKYIETYWSMELRVGGRMQHICRKVVN